MSSPTTKPRDYLFDNCKAFLILMVVLGHFTEGSYQHTDFLYTLKWLIVSFHMPAFIKDEDQSYIYLILPVNFNAAV